MPYGKTNGIVFYWDVQKREGIMDTMDLGSAADVRRQLSEYGYLPDEHIAGTVHLAAALGKPVLVEGPAGTGKTELAKSVAAITDARLIRLQCYEGLDESRALYEWDYRRQLLAIQAGRSADDAGAIDAGIFDEKFLLTRPLLEAIRAKDRVVLLIDEVDRLDIETEALLLEILSDFQVSIPELGTVVATQKPLVFLTSNNTRDLSEALKRRCLYLHVGYPSAERERDIVMSKVPGITEHVAGQVTAVVDSLRSMNLKKKPSISETLDWARTLVLLGTEEVDVQTVVSHLHVLLKYQSDIESTTAELGTAHA
jgi:MoxR-like ATPase